MIKKCNGCGAIFQFHDLNKEGYVTEDAYETATLCRRCFRIKNYGECALVNKDTNDYKTIFDNLKEKNDLVLFLCDILNLDESIEEINEFKGHVILVITKIDLLPKSVKVSKLKDYINKNYKLNVLDIVFVSAIKNNNIDFLLNLIKKKKKSKNVYLVGNTNAGKSTLINSFIKAAKCSNAFITTSFLPATTLGMIEINFDEDLTLIDTPGIVTGDSFILNEKASVIKKVTPKKEIKPRTYQMKPNESIIIEDYARIDYTSDIKNSFTLYLSNDIKVKRIKLNTNDYLRNLKSHKFDLKNNNDVVINGLCFCKITNEAKINIFVKENVKVFNRDNLI